MRSQRVTRQKVRPDLAADFAQSNIAFDLVTELIKNDPMSIPQNHTSRSTCYLGDRHPSNFESLKMTSPVTPVNRLLPHIGSASVP